jgi:hypothetical protein
MTLFPESRIHRKFMITDKLMDTFLTGTILNKPPHMVKKAFRLLQSKHIYNLINLPQLKDGTLVFELVSKKRDDYIEAFLSLEYSLLCAWFSSVPELFYACLIRKPELCSDLLNTFVWMPHFLSKVEEESRLNSNPILDYAWIRIAGRANEWGIPHTINTDLATKN